LALAVAEYPVMVEPLVVLGVENPTVAIPSPTDWTPMFPTDPGTDAALAETVPAVVPVPNEFLAKTLKR
jgi:hypothetical protein